MPTLLSPAAEKARRDAARAVLAKLATGRFFKKSQLFEGAHERHVNLFFQNQFLRRLRDLDLVRTSGASKNTEYALTNSADVSGFMNDEAALTKLVFPHASPTLDDVVGDLVEDADAVVAASEPEEHTEDTPHGANGAVEDVRGVEGATPAEEMLLKINAALLETVVNMRAALDSVVARIGALEPKIQESHEILRELRDPVPTAKKG